MDSTGPIEVGWKKELLTNSRESRSKHKSKISKKTKKKKYHKLSSSEDESSSKSSRSRSSSSSSSTSKSFCDDNKSSDDNKKKRKREKKEKKEKRKEEKRLKKQRKAIEKIQKKEFKKAMKEKRKEEKRLKKIGKSPDETAPVPVTTNLEEEVASGADYSIPIDLMYVKSYAPESREEHEKKQSQIRRVVDPETGRTRLIKGDGEILEEIVSKERHKEINKQATRADGEYFQSKTVGWDISS